MLDRVGKWLGERDAGLDVLCDWPKEELIGKTVEEKRIILAAHLLARIDGGRGAVRAAWLALDREAAQRFVAGKSDRGADWQELANLLADILEAMPTEEGAE